MAISPSPERRSRSGSVASASRSQMHAGGLPERADEVLALREVDAGLAADRRVDHAEQRRRHVDDRHAAVPRGGGEPGDVGDHAAADGDHDVVAGEPDGGEPAGKRPRPSPGSCAARRRRSRTRVRRAPGSTRTGSWPGSRRRPLHVGRRSARRPADEHVVRALAGTRIVITASIGSTTSSGDRADVDDASATSGRAPRRSSGAACPGRLEQRTMVSRRPVGEHRGHSSHTTRAPRTRRGSRASTTRRRGDHRGARRALRPAPVSRTERRSPSARRSAHGAPVLLDELVGVDERPAEPTASGCRRSSCRRPSSRPARCDRP